MDGSNFKTLRQLKQLLKFSLFNWTYFIKFGEQIRKDLEHLGIIILI